MIFANPLLTKSSSKQEFGCDDFVDLLLMRVSEPTSSQAYHQQSRICFKEAAEGGFTISKYSLNRQATKTAILTSRRFFLGFLHQISR